MLQLFTQPWIFSTPDLDISISLVLDKFKKITIDVVLSHVIPAQYANNNTIFSMIIVDDEEYSHPYHINYIGEWINENKNKIDNNGYVRFQFDA